MAQNKAMADQIMTVSKERLTERLGLLSRNKMHGVKMRCVFDLGVRPEAPRGKAVASADALVWAAT
jgi:hypothetical protein